MKPMGSINGVRVGIAAANNAHLYRRVCGAHGVGTELVDGRLVVQGTPPRFYSNVVTLMPEARVLAGAGAWTMKDSFFACEPAGCDVLFEASWIWREPTDGALELAWGRVQTPAELELWLKGWGGAEPESERYPPQFPASMLSDPEFSFWWAEHDGCSTGCLLNFSGSAVGISNAFCTATNCNHFRDFARLAGIWRPGFPVVGYERDDSLENALAAGFEDVGRLRIWHKQA